MTINPHTNKKMVSSFTQNKGIANKTELPPKMRIDITAMTFVFLEIQRCSFQLRMMGPKVGFDNNQLCQRSEDFAKHPAATNKNGVVGSTGKKIPSVAKPTNPIPRNLYRNVNLFEFLFNVIQAFFDLNEFVDNDDVSILGINANRAVVAGNHCGDFIIGLFINIHNYPLLSRQNTDQT